METLSFTLGVLAVIDLLIVAGTFLVLKTMNITRKKAEETQRSLEHEIFHLTTLLESTTTELHRRLDDLRELSGRHTDSRVDKLEAKIYKEFDIYRTQGKQYM